VARECRRILRAGGYVCVRTATRENDVVIPRFFPAVRAMLDADLPSGDDIRSSFITTGFAAEHHAIITEMVAPDWPVFVRTSAFRADSFLARLSETEFDRGMTAGRRGRGYCGEVSTMTLAPQIVDAVSPIPVVAAGGIFDGRGIAAALMFGAVGVNLGTRFITSTEAPAPEEWKRAMTGAKSEDAIKVDVLNDISPLPGTEGFHTVGRSLPTAFWMSGAASARPACRTATEVAGCSARAGW